ncbi:uncharacterized protein LOC109864178 [Pseudomyrmex gracilis]|uniref:uncharacterized protein LOC109864178 n=1 Tax=Pseudomyrmex gracilis TaxID=219809 RepID=UPI000994B325|nr:uncharacterized protein LOC109864178 [Pseudomyrmex gracilis]
MRCSVLCVLLLAISEPLLVHAKVVLVVPRHIRQETSWRPPPNYYKKSSYGGNDFQRPSYYSHANRYYNRKPYRPLPYPQGGNDFDQGHEPVNHMHIRSYSKDIGHGISFGKGYIPYENIKSSSLPFVHERYAGAYTHQPAVPNYPPTSFTSVGQDYATSATTHTFQNPQIDSFFSDVETTARGAELPDSLKDSANKYYASRSIERELSLRNQQALNSVMERDRNTLARDNEGLTAKDVSSVAYNHAAATAGMQGAVILPAGIPSATIAGNRDGIVLRDTVSLDDYHRKLEELTKTWPNVLSAAGSSPSFAAISASHPHQLRGVGLPTGYGAPTGTDWISPSFAQSKQGYAVREDTGDTATHDFRTMQIHAPYQQSPLGVNAIGLPAGPTLGFAPSIHG